MGEISKLDYDSIFSRNIGMYSPDLAELMKKSHVAIIGLGGPGGAATEVLARMGIGKLTLADFDTVAIHNINRQAAARISTIGEKKIEVLEKLVKDINPQISLKLFSEGLTVQNTQEVLDGVDAVIDMMDFYDPHIRLNLHKTAKENDQYVFSTPAGGFGCLVMCFAPEGLSMQELLQLPDNPTTAHIQNVDHEKLMGGNLAYLPKLFYEKLQGKNPYVSVVAGSVHTAGGATAIQVIKHLMSKAQQKKPEQFKEYGNLQVTQAPHAIRIDLWDSNYSRIVDLTNLKSDITGQKVWDDITAAYVGFIHQTFHHKDLIRELADHTGNAKNVLDLGCGPGALINELLKRDPNRTVTGVDTNENMLEIAKEKVIDKNYLERAKLVHADATNYLPDKKYSVVVSSNLLFNLSNPLDFIQYVRDNCLEPGGKFILTSARPNPDLNMMVEKGIADLRNKGKCTKEIERYANTVKNVNERFMGKDNKNEKNFSAFTNKEIELKLEEQGFTIEYSGSAYLNQSFLVVAKIK